MELITHIQYDDRDGNGTWREKVTTAIVGDQRKKERLRLSHRKEVADLLIRLKNSGYANVHIVYEHECPMCSGHGVIYRRK